LPYITTWDDSQSQNRPTNSAEEAEFLDGVFDSDVLQDLLTTEVRFDHRIELDLTVRPIAGFERATHDDLLAKWRGNKTIHVDRTGAVLMLAGFWILLSVGVLAACFVPPIGRDHAFIVPHAGNTPMFYGSK
jgi:hypothetical protein